MGQPDQQRHCARGHNRQLLSPAIAEELKADETGRGEEHWSQGEVQEQGAAGTVTEHVEKRKEEERVQRRMARVDEVKSVRKTMNAMSIESLPVLPGDV